MLRFIRYFLIFVVLIIFQIYFEGNIFLRPIINLSLLFFVWSFFILPWPFLLIFAIMAGIIFDTFSGLPWSLYLISFILVLLIGLLLTKIFEIKSFWSRLLIGESMINIYFAILFFVTLILLHLNLIVIVAKNMFINSFIYLVLLSLLNYRILYEFKKKYYQA